MDIDYSKICFVIMPFGSKPVGGKTVDFDALYSGIFVPAISSVDLPEGGKLQAHRTDQDFFTGDIKFEMFQYLEYSRFALADISGLNPNVVYELGVRHCAREAGTAIFRQEKTALPFDISSIKAFPYEYEPAGEAEKARAMIAGVLTESLVRNRPDSPVRLALNAQRESGQIDDLLAQAENAIRNLDFPGAMDIYRQAVAADPGNPLPKMKLGLLCKKNNIWDEALQQFTDATAVAAGYSEAWRERGIAENKSAQLAGQPLDTRPAPGELSVRKAIELNQQGFDAWGALGGILRRAQRFQESLDAYKQSMKLSGNHPYPLLNALVLRPQVKGQLALTPADMLALGRALFVRQGQAKQDPPFDSPWCFFDIALIKLFQGDGAAFKATALTGFNYPDTVDWQRKTFVDSLHLLLPAAKELPGLQDGLTVLEPMLS